MLVQCPREEIRAGCPRQKVRSCCQRLKASAKPAHFARKVSSCILSCHTCNVLAGLTFQAVSSPLLLISPPLQKKVVEQLRKELLVKQEPETKLQLHVQAPPVGGDLKPANLLQSQPIPGALQQVPRCRCPRPFWLLHPPGCAAPGPGGLWTLFDCGLPADADGHAGPHHKGPTSGAESWRHSCPARFCPVATPAHRRNGNHVNRQTRVTERPHQPAGGQQADQSELRARATGLQERHGGECCPSSPVFLWSVCPWR